MQIDSYRPRMQYTEPLSISFSQPHALSYTQVKPIKYRESLPLENTGTHSIQNQPTLPIPNEQLSAIGADKPLALELNISCNNVTYVKHQPSSII